VKIISVVKISIMTEKISEPVSVSLGFDHIKGKSSPKWVVWNGRMYPVVKVGLHHTFRQGRTLFHVFSVISKTAFFRLVFNTDSLHWSLEEVGNNDLN